MLNNDLQYWENLPDWKERLKRYNEEELNEN